MLRPQRFYLTNALSWFSCSTVLPWVWLISLPRTFFFALSQGNSERKKLKRTLHLLLTVLSWTHGLNTAVYVFPSWFYNCVKFDIGQEFKTPPRNFVNSHILAWLYKLYEELVLSLVFFFNIFDQNKGWGLWFFLFIIWQYSVQQHVIEFCQ